MRLPGIARGPVAWLLIAYLALRFFAAIGLTPQRFNDTASYFTLDFTGRSVRLWTVPLLYRLLPSDGWRVAGQLVASSVAWIALALAAATCVRGRRLKLISVGAVLCASLTGQVLSWDLTLLSESLSITLTVAAIAAWLLFVRAPGWRTLVPLALIMLFWTFSRHTHVLLGFCLVLLVAISLCLRGNRIWRAGGLAALIAISQWGLWAMNRSSVIERYNLYTLVQARILPDVERSRWFEERGLPGDLRRWTARQGYLSYHEALALPDYRDAVLREVPEPWDVPATLADGRLRKWLDEHGLGAYKRFLLEHPSCLLLEPLTRATRHLSLREGSYGEARPVLPRPLRELVFGDGGELVFGGLLCLGLLLAVLRARALDFRDAVVLALFALSYAHLLLCWHGSGTEVSRHLVTVGVMLRLAILLTILFCADRINRHPEITRGQE